MLDPASLHPLTSRQDYRVHSSKQATQIRIQNHVCQRSAVRCGNQLNASPLRADLVNHKRFRRVILNGLRHAAILLRSVSDLHSASVANGSMRLLSFTGNLMVVSTIVTRLPHGSAANIRAMLRKQSGLFHDQDWPQAVHFSKSFFVFKSKV